MAALGVAAGLILIATQRRKPLSLPVESLPPHHPEGVPSDLEALARMLASEDADPAIQVAIAWIAIQTARRRKQSLLAVLTSGLGWGPQKIWVNGKKVIRFASTEKPGSDTTWLLAQAVLSGVVEPSVRFRSAAPTSFVERSRASTVIGVDGKPLQPATDDARLIALQTDFGGLVGRMGRWYFYRLGARTVMETTALPQIG
jgi:hypothetical protein